VPTSIGFAAVTRSVDGFIAGTPRTVLRSDSTDTLTRIQQKRRPSSLECVGLWRASCPPLAPCARKWFSSDTPDQAHRPNRRKRWPQLLQLKG